MKLVHTSQYYWPFVGGAECYCQAISEGLAVKHEVEVCSTNVISTSPLSFSANYCEIRNNVKIKRAPSVKLLAGIYGGNKQNRRSNSVFQILSDSDKSFSWPFILLERSISSSVPQSFFWLTEQMRLADVIVIFNIITGMTSLSYLASRFHQKPFVVFPMYHVGLPSYEKPSLFKILKGASLSICSTEFEKNALIQKGIEPQKLKVVNEGTSIPVVSNEEVSRLGMIIEKDLNGLVLMYVGRRDYDKGYPHVISAVTQLVKKDFAIKLIVCGRGKALTESPDYDFLLRKKALVDLGVAEDHTKVAAMSLSDAIVLPSRAETYPLVFVESWLLGKPVIGAKIGSVSSIVREGIDGLLVSFGDIEELINAIKFFYSNPDKRIKMGLEGQVRAKKKFTLESAVQRVRDIFDELSKRA